MAVKNAVASLISGGSAVGSIRAGIVGPDGNPAPGCPEGADVYVVTMEGNDVEDKFFYVVMH